MLLLSAHAVGLGLDHVGAQTTLLGLDQTTLGFSRKIGQQIQGFRFLLGEVEAKGSVMNRVRPD
jgi:hypothetical protein